MLSGIGLRSALNIRGQPLAGACLVAAGLYFEIIDHAFHTGNSSTDAYRLPHILVVENYPRQHGHAIF